jgi:hypothetical protein
MKFQTTSKLILFKSGSIVEDGVILLLFPEKLLVRINFVKNILLSNSVVKFSQILNNHITVEFINFNDYLNYIVDEPVYIGIFDNKNIYLHFNINTTSKYADRQIHYYCYVSSCVEDEADKIGLVLTENRTLILKSSNKLYLIKDELDYTDTNYILFFIKIGFFFIVFFILLLCILI